ncbi:hypothetical protein [Rhizobium paknamense]|uniref:Uncharacterized protein n=1 Tax=Rhizobium paknamense TaxID=1206817 RepID=A0ABU0I8U7_9HYPH|nr:hypothetical protein [Rhizobium paknamense]MDQ0454663.1 hypothetical protein [Rhizobium paknamense]
MSRGFIKPVNGSFRMRIVKAGYDANNFSIPQNAVVFDSDALSYLQVFLSGSLLISSAQGAAKLVTWPSLGFIPIAWAAHKKDGAYIAPITTNRTDYNIGEVLVEADGLTVETRSLNYPVYLDYVVWRSQAL